MAADEAAGEGAGQEGAGEAPETEVGETRGVPVDPSDLSGDEEETTYYVEVWNDYDPSMRFVALFPVGEKEGAMASSVAYYIIEAGKHSGLHSDNAEEIAFVAEGEGEAFVIGGMKKLEPGKFFVFPAGVDHDIYAQGSAALRLLSFFPTTEILSTFQQAIYPMGGNVLSSKPPAAQGPVVTELDPNNLPEDFPFSLADLGMAEEAPRELTTTQRLLGMTEPGVPPPELNIRVINPNAPEENQAADAAPEPAEEEVAGASQGEDRPDE
jgi:quercetin dioxygenase-like cupin family protein